MMSLIAGVVLLVLSAFMLSMLSWGARRAQEPAWASERWMSLCHIPLVVSLLAFGVAFVISGIVSIAA
jgi:hypothetical protein